MSAPVISGNLCVNIDLILKCDFKILCLTDLLLKNNFVFFSQANTDLLKPKSVT